MSSLAPPLGSFTSAAGPPRTLSKITEFLALPATLAATLVDREPTGSERETDGRCGGGSVVPGLVRDESGCVDVGVDARRSLYEMKDKRLWAACDGEGG